MKKLFITLILTAFTIGAGVFAADLVIESKTQSYSETDNKIKFDGDVKVTIDEMKVVGDSADVAVTDKQELDTATFYDKPYAFEVNLNKKREVKANILQVSLINKVVRAEGDTQSIISTLIFFPCFWATERIRVRISLAILPWRPITFPISPGATRNS